MKSPKKIISLLLCSSLSPTFGDAGPIPPSMATLPPDHAYVTTNEAGHLTVGGERQRYWAAIGKLFIPTRIQPGDDDQTRAAKLERSRRGTDFLLDRFAEYGFNAVRLWDVTTDEDYQPGDGSHADALDYFLARASERGFRVWAAGFGNRVGRLSAADVDILDDPSTASQWVDAIREYNEGSDKKDIRKSLARIWDPRIEAVYIERMRAIGNHFNKHRGLRWADDPVFAIWELTNEEWWMSRMLGGGWLKEPKFFRDQLIRLWNQWLLDKYENDANLSAAWGGLLPGESASEGSVIFAPIRGRSDPALTIGDANPAALAALMSTEQTLTRSDFEPQRARDLIEFLLEIQLAHKERSSAAVRDLGKSTRLGVIIHDTGIGYEIQSQYLHQLSDASVHDAYVNGWGPRPSDPDLEGLTSENRRRLRILDAERISATTGPWVNWLLKPPGISQGVPWLEHNKIEGKPFLVYETQIQQPAKYRADFPLRLAALASIQDWDWVSWHYFATHDEVGVVENPMERPLDVTTGSHPQGYHYTYDEVQNAMMRQAALIWRGVHLEPAPNPTRFIYGKRSLTDPDSMDYAGSYGTKGFDMLQTVYQHGVRIEIDPTREDDEVIGPVVSFEDRNTHNPYTPTNAITFDWKKGYLLFDNSSTMAFTGLLAKYGSKVEFSIGLILKNVAINNPEGIFSPIEEKEQYLAFALVTEDGLPLSDTRKASLALHSTSFNTGFSWNPDLVLEKRHPRLANTVQGNLPVLVARVAATIQSPDLQGFSFTAYDWNSKVVSTGTIEGDTLSIPSDLPISYLVLER
ncbi:MAG: hypothetical protein ACFCU4_03340 [Puniceicoccaceae bacterium]